MGYLGNTNTGFGGPVGNGLLTFTDDGTTLTGTISATGLNNELVIYIDSKVGGFTTNGTQRATLNFAAGFAADFALAISPNGANFGALFTLDNISNFTYGTNGTDGNLGLTPTGTANGPLTFSVALAKLGVMPGSSFGFTSTYGNFNSDIYRSNEAYVTTFSGTAADGSGNFGQNPATANSFSSYTVPEPSAFVMLIGGAGLLLRRDRRQS